MLVSRIYPQRPIGRRAAAHQLHPIRGSTPHRSPLPNGRGGSGNITASMRTHTAPEVKWRLHLTCLDCAQPPIDADLSRRHRNGAYPPADNAPPTVNGSRNLFRPPPDDLNHRFPPFHVSVYPKKPAHPRQPGLRQLSTGRRHRAGGRNDALHDGHPDIIQGYSFMPAFPSSIGKFKPVGAGYAPHRVNDPDDACQTSERARDFFQRSKPPDALTFRRFAGPTPQSQPDWPLTGAIAVKYRCDHPRSPCPANFCATQALTPPSATSLAPEHAKACIHPAAIRSLPQRSNAA